MSCVYVMCVCACVCNKYYCTATANCISLRTWNDKISLFRSAIEHPDSLSLSLSLFLFLSLSLSHRRHIFIIHYRYINGISRLRSLFRYGLRTIHPIENSREITLLISLIRIFPPSISLFLIHLLHLYRASGSRAVSVDRDVKSTSNMSKG